MKSGWTRYIERHGSPNKGKVLTTCVACGKKAFTPCPPSIAIFTEFPEGNRCEHCWNPLGYAILDGFHKYRIGEFPIPSNWYLEGGVFKRPPRVKPKSKGE